MRVSWFLALLLAVALSGGPGRLAVLGPDGRVTVVSGDQTRTVMPPQRHALSVVWAPAGDRLVVVEEVKLGTVTPFRLIVRGIEKGTGKPRQIQPTSQDFLLWREIVGLAWPRADLITVEGRIDPDTVMMAEVDPRSGALLSTQPGKGFFWSPSGSRLAAIGWFPHFGPAPKEGDRVEIDGKVVYQGAKGNVIKPPLLWSLDGGQLAFIEQHGDGLDLLIAPTSLGGEPRRVTLAGRSALLAWSDDDRALLLRNGQEEVRLDAATGASEHFATHDLASQGFARFAAAADSAARAAQMEGRASSWWTPPGAAVSPKGQTP
jgi:hypothetical protein